MLMLLFRVGEKRWAIASSHIQDVIPLVDLLVSGEVLRQLAIAPIFSQLNGVH